MNAKDLKWYVYRYNCNARKIETYNVIGGKYFFDVLKKMMKKNRNKADFDEALKSEMMYHFWSRAEWELIIEITEDNRIFLSPWVGCKDPENACIDVTDDTGFDWRGFAELHIGRQIYKNKAKIDVYDQLDYVWDDFVDYCWNSKVYKPRKKKEENLGGDYKMVTIKELTRLERMYNEWKSRELTDEERSYNKNFPHVFARAIQCDFDPETQSKIALNLYNSLDDFCESYYIVVNEDSDEAKYLTFYAELTNDISKAAICVNETTAFFLIDDYKEEKYRNHEISKEEWDDHNCNIGFKIVPVKRVVSYERV